MTETATAVSAVADAAIESGEPPEGWTLAGLTEVCALNPPKPAKDALAGHTPVTFVPMPAVDAESGSILTPSLRPFGEVRKGFTAFRDGDVIFAKITPCMENGKSAIGRGLTNGLGFGSTEFHVLRPTPVVLAEYVHFFVRQESFRRAAAEEMTGSVGQKRVPASYLESVSIPLPPLAEQKRIVAEIERLLAEVNKAREHLDRVPKLLKRLRQSILAAAIDGEITADWRSRQPSLSDAVDLLKRIQSERSALEPSKRSREVENVQPVDRELPEGWTWMRVADALAYDRTAAYGVLQPGGDLPSGVPLVRVCDLSNGTVLLNQLKKIAPSIDAQYVRTRLQGGEVLVSLVGTIGRTAVAPKEAGGANVARAVAMLPLCRHVIPEYLNIALSEPKTNYQMTDLAREVARKTLNLGLLKGVQVPLPTLDEQQEIVGSVRKLMAVTDEIEARLADAKRNAETAPQAIFAKAFRGELVPTEAELARTENRPYESATQLLARISSGTDHDPESKSTPKARKQTRRKR